MIPLRGRQQPIPAAQKRTREMTSGLSVGVLAVLYLVLLVWLGVRTLRRGHWVMFVVGLFIPLFWIIGALIPRTR